MNLTRAGIPIILFFLIAHLVLLGVAWFSGQMGLWRPLYYLSLGLAVVLGVLTAFSLFFPRSGTSLSAGRASGGKSGGWQGTGGG